MSFTSEQREFLKRGQARVIVPEGLRNQEGAVQSEESVLDIKQRDKLFFDERLKVFVVLKLPECEEQILKSYLSKLDIGIDVWASNEGDNVHRPSANPATSRDLLSSHDIQRDEDPVVLLTQDDNDQVFINMVWETVIIINRPRIRLVEPCITIIPRASISPLPSLASSDVFLEPYVSQEANIFDSLKGAKGFEESTPYFPASRLRTVLPTKPKQDHSFHFAVASPKMTRVFLVSTTRLRYTKAWGQPAGTALTASLDLEMLPYAEVQGSVVAVDIHLASGTAIPLTNDILPLRCQSKDCITFLYQLQMSSNVKQHASIITDPNIDVMSISIKLNLHLTDNCQPEIITEWTTNVDFSQASGIPSAGASQSLQRANKPSSLSLQRPNSVIGLMPQPNMGDGLLTISFSSPIERVKIGKPFVWKVLVVNRTAATARLAIIPLPRMQRTISQAQQYARRHASRNSNTSFKHIEKTQELDLADVAQASIDENILYAMQHSGGLTTQADIVSLTSELRIGPLLSGQCYEDEIRFVALKKGPCMVDAIRVVDLVREAEHGPTSPGVIMDIRDLPDLVVEE